MSDWDREVFIDIEPDIRVRYCRTHHPPIRYAVTLEVLSPSGWETAQLWDNAHAVDEHHEHEYTRRDGKRPAVILLFDSVSEAMSAAIRKATDEWRTIIERWKANE